MPVLGHGGSSPPSDTRRTPERSGVLLHAAGRRSHRRCRRSRSSRPRGSTPAAESPPRSSEVDVDLTGPDVAQPRPERGHESLPRGGSAVPSGHTRSRSNGPRSAAPSAARWPGSGWPSSTSRTTRSTWPRPVRCCAWRARSSTPVISRPLPHRSPRRSGPEAIDRIVDRSIQLCGCLGVHRWSIAVRAVKEAAAQPTRR